MYAKEQNYFNNIILLMVLCLVMDKNIFTFINNFFSFFIIIFVHISSPINNKI